MVLPSLTCVGKVIMDSKVVVIVSRMPVHRSLSVGVAENRRRQRLMVDSSMTVSVTVAAAAQSPASGRGELYKTLALDQCLHAFATVMDTSASFCPLPKSSQNQGSCRLKGMIGVLTTSGRRRFWTYDAGLYQRHSISSREGG